MKFKCLECFSDMIVYSEGRDENIKHKNFMCPVCEKSVRIEWKVKRS